MSQPSRRPQREAIKVRGEHRQTHYFVYILEASLAFRNGMVIPLLSEFLDYAKGGCRL